jgi:hypothetical protein
VRGYFFSSALLPASNGLKSRGVIDNPQSARAHPLMIPKGWGECKAQRGKTAPGLTVEPTGLKLAKTLIGVKHQVDQPQIDSAVLALARPSWTKVAMLLSKTAEVLGCPFPRTREGFEVISGRIEALVRDGHLEAQGGP